MIAPLLGQPTQAERNARTAVYVAGRRDGKFKAQFCYLSGRSMCA